MFYIILVIAGLVLAANRKQAAADAASAPMPGPARTGPDQQDTVTIGPMPNYYNPLFPTANFHIPLPTGPGIGVGLQANNPGWSNVIVSGPYIYNPGKGGPTGAPAAAAGGGAAAPSGGVSPGSGGTGYGPPSAPHLPNVL